MLDRLSIKVKLGGAFAIVIVLFATAVWVALGGLRSVGAEFEEFFRQNYAQQSAFQQMYADGLLSGVALRNLVLKPHLKKPYKVVPDAIDRFDAAYKKALQLAAGDDAARQQLEAIHKHWQLSRAAKLRVLDLMKAGDQQGATELLANEEHPNWQKVRIAVQNLVAAEQKKVVALQEAILANESSAIRVAMVFALLAIIVGIFVAFVITGGIQKSFRRVTDSLNDIASGEGDLTQRLDESGAPELSELACAFNQFVEKIQDLVKQVSDSTNTLTASSKQVSEIAVDTKLNVNQQESKIEHVATAMNEMTATVQEVAHHAQDAAEAARSADDESNDGFRVVTEVVEAINHLARQVGETANTIHSLEENAEQIGSVLDVIRGIAEQTNLLALNAAIEAARAGEQGRGFAVVADEVRTLASRTQQSTEEIQQTIERLQAGAKAAVTSMEDGQQQTQTTVEKAGKAGDALSTITQAVSRIVDMNSQIATAAEQQSAVAEDINKNVVSISTLSVQAAQGAEHVAGSSQELERLAENIQRLVTIFKV